MRMTSVAQFGSTLRQTHRACVLLGAWTVVRVSLQPLAVAELCWCLAVVCQTIAVVLIEEIANDSSDKTRAGRAVFTITLLVSVPMEKYRVVRRTDSLRCRPADESSHGSDVVRYCGRMGPIGIELAEGPRNCRDCFGGVQTARWNNKRQAHVKNGRLKRAGLKNAHTRHRERNSALTGPLLCPCASVCPTVSSVACASGDRASVRLCSKETTTTTTSLASALDEEATTHTQTRILAHGQSLKASLSQTQRALGFIVDGLGRESRPWELEGDGREREGERARRRARHSPWRPSPLPSGGGLRGRERASDDEQQVSWPSLVALHISNIRALP